MNKMLNGIGWILLMSLTGGVATATADTVLLIKVGSNGELTVTDANGNPAEKCYVEPESKPRCHGFDQNGEVLKVSPITVFHTRGSNCAVVYGFGGIAYQVC